MYHFIYKTTNLNTDKFYIGKHSTNNLNDGYLGSGRGLLAALNKHGKENFKTEIIEFFETEEEAIRRESEIVTKDFCNRDDVYNINAANQGFTWTSTSRPEQSKVMKDAQPWLNSPTVTRTKNQSGSNNPMWNRTAPNAKKIRVVNTSLGIDIIVPSLRVASEYIGMDRANARKLLQKKSKSRKGWILEDATCYQ